MEMRAARYEDCRALALFKIKVWETTYRGIYPNEKLDQSDIEANEKKFEDMIKQRSQKLFVVLDKGEIIGYMSYGKILRAFDEHTHDIGLLYVAKEYQGQGIGKRLFQFAKQKLEKEGVTEFIVSCNKYNFPAQQFYKKMGGTIIKVEKDNEDKSIPQVKFKFVQ